MKVSWMAAALLAIPALARADLITNGSFELGSPQPAGNGESLPNGSTAMTGWTVFGGNASDGLAWLPDSNGYGVSTPFGNNFLDLTGYRDQTPYFGVEQTITTVMGQTYTLAYYLGVDQSSSIYNGPIEVTATAGSTSQPSGPYNPAGTGNIWQQFTLNFTATSTSTLISIQGTQGDRYIGLDNVSVNPVPEPSSLALGAIGAAAALATLRRRAAGA